MINNTFKYEFKTTQKCANLKQHLLTEKTAIQRFISSKKRMPSG